MRYRYAALLAVLGLLIGVGIVFADHFTYHVENPQGEISTLDGYENWIMYNWAVENKDVVWKADSAVRADVAEAISHWEDVFSLLGRRGVG